MRQWLQSQAYSTMNKNGMANCLKANIIRKQSLERHGNEVRGTQGGNVRGSHLRGEVQGVFGQ